MFSRVGMSWCIRGRSDGWLSLVTMCELFSSLLILSPHPPSLFLVRPRDRHQASGVQNTDRKCFLQTYRPCQWCQTWIQLESLIFKIKTTTKLTARMRLGRLSVSIFTNQSSFMCPKTSVCDSRDLKVTSVAQFFFLKARSARRRAHAPRRMDKRRGGKPSCASQLLQQTRWRLCLVTR